ncbi:hypothetical protein G5B35_16015 [Parapusillimonas sp. SGNA-6]|nr:hypothetical protein [Parapusillimonas sp. SGNA-6]
MNCYFLEQLWVVEAGLAIFAHAASAFRIGGKRARCLNATACAAGRQVSSRPTPSRNTDAGSDGAASTVKRLARLASTAHSSPQEEYPTSPQEKYPTSPQEKYPTSPQEKSRVDINAASCGTLK